jgi:hypothetical protein
MPVETRIQVRQGTTSAWNTASTATITNAVASTAPRTVTAASRTAGSNEVTITAAGATAAYAVGSSITIYGTGNATVNGTWTVTGNASTNQVKFASTATTALALTGLTGSVYATTATVGVITYTASNSFNVGDKVSVFGINPTNFDVTNATILSASSTAFTVAGSVSGDPIPTYTSGGFARSVILASGELGLDTTTGRISVGDGTTYWGDAKQLAWSNSSQTLTGTQTLYPSVGNATPLKIYAKPDRTYSLYKGEAATNGVYTYYSTALLSEVGVGERVTITGFATSGLNLSDKIIASVASDKMSFTVNTYVSISAIPAGTATATASVTEAYNTPGRTAILIRADANGTQINFYTSTSYTATLFPGDTVTVTGFNDSNLNVVRATVTSVTSGGFYVNSTAPTNTEFTSNAFAVKVEPAYYLLEAWAGGNRVAYIKRDGTLYGSVLEARGVLSTDISNFAGDNYTYGTGAYVRLVSNASGFAYGDRPSLESHAQSTSTRYHIAFSNTNGASGAPAVVGKISTNAAATSYTTSSDYRLKENVVPITSAANRVLELNPVQFNWIGHEGSAVDGFLAHEVQEVVPEAIDGVKDAVDEDGNPIYQGIDQSKLVPLLTAALQDALLRIEALEAKVN